jgi:hypothetical protein
MSPNSLDGVSQQAGQLSQLGSVITHRGPDQLSIGRARVAPVGVLFGSWGIGEFQCACHQIGRRDAVGQGVVDLADDRKPVVRHALDEMELPQRPAAIQRSAGDLSDRGIQLAVTTWRSDLPASDVVVEVDVAIFQPHLAMQPARDVDQLIAQRFEQMQPPREGLTEAVVSEVSAVRRVDDGDLQGVLVQVGRLVVEQDRIPASKPLHRSSRPCIGIRVFGYPRLRAR